MNVFLKVAVVLFLVFASWVEARANTMMDRVELCNRITAGAGARMAGFQGRTEWVSREQFKQYAEQHYTGGMYIRDDGETPEERAKYDEPMMLGWNMQDDYIKKHGGQPKDPKAILEACMKQTDANAGRIYQAASSQGLVEPFTSLERLCAFRVQIMSSALPYKQQMSVDELLKDQPFPDSWSDGMKDIARKDIAEMFEFAGEGRVFIQNRYQACMGK